MSLLTAPTTDTEFRAAIVAALDNPEWSVHGEPVDAIEPPCFMVVPSERDDWFTPSTGCAYVERYEVAAIVGRVDLSPVFADLVAMVEFELRQLRVARIPLGVTSSAKLMSVGGLDYLAARTSVHSQITIDPEG